jgi:hypothetical protein
MQRIGTGGSRPLSEPEERQSARSPTRGEQEVEVGFRQDALPGAPHHSGHDRVVQLELALFERHHLLLNAVAHENPHDRDRLPLPDAMRAVRRLTLHRRIPPGVQMENIARSCEIQPLPSRLETQEKHARLFTGLKRRHAGLARSRRRGPIQPVIGQSMPSACFLHEVQKAGELRKYQGAVPLIAQDVEPLHQKAELGGGLIGLLRKEAGRKTDLPQFEDGRERDKLGLPGSLGTIGIVDR